MDCVVWFLCVVCCFYPRISKYRLANHHQILNYKFLFNYNDIVNPTFIICFNCDKLLMFPSLVLNIPGFKTMTCETAQIQDDNPYKKVVLNKVFKEEEKSLEMRNWSFFSDNVRYVQHDQVTPQNLNFDALDYRDHKDLYLKLRGEKGDSRC